MPYNPHIHHRRSIRLKGYDYSQAGLYFITICAQNRAHLFGEIAVGAALVAALDEKGRPQEHAQMILNDAGMMIVNEWLKLPNRFTNIQLYDFVVMPNHFHAVLEIVHIENATGKTVGDMMDAFKSITTVEYIRGVKTMGWDAFDGKLWQRDYWEHIIRNENDYLRIADYITNNPQNWDIDTLK